MKRVTFFFWWRLWHACGLAFWVIVEGRLPRVSVEFFIVFIPICYHLTFLIAKPPGRRSPPPG